MVDFDFNIPPPVYEKNKIDKYRFQMYTSFNGFFKKYVTNLSDTHVCGLYSRWLEILDQIAIYLNQHQNMPSEEISPNSDRIVKMEIYFQNTLKIEHFSPSNSKKNLKQKGEQFKTMKKNGNCLAQGCFSAPIENTIQVEEGAQIKEEPAPKRNSNPFQQPKKKCFTCGNEDGYILKCGHYLGKQCLIRIMKKLSDYKFDNTIYKSKCPRCDVMIEKADIHSICSIEEIENLKQKEQPSNPPIFKCPIDLQYHSLSEMRTLDCDHKFCEDCLKSYIENLINSAQVNHITCPESGCNVIINDNLIYDLIDQNMQDKLVKFRLRSLNMDEKLCICCDPLCEFAVFIPKNQKFYQCPKCEKRWCTECNNPAHNNYSCEQFNQILRQRNREEKKNSEAFRRYTEENNIFQCPKCQVFIENDKTGCNFLTCNSPVCKSKTHFCALCQKILQTRQHYTHYKRGGPFKMTCNTLDNIPDDDDEIQV